MHRQPIGEIDLLAYADGLLDDDPGRKAEVEKYLEARPVETSRLRDYMQQNEEIRKLYGLAMAEPVPDRLHAVLFRRPGRIMHHAARAALAASLLMAAGFAGWTVGKTEQPSARLGDAFVKQAMSDYLKFENKDTAQDGIVQAAGIQPLSWLSGGPITADIRPPSLIGQGFKLLDRRLISADGQRLVRLTYGDSRGRKLSLFVRARWPEQPSQINFAKNNGVTMAYWLDGPLVFGLAGKLGRQEMLAFAQAARKSMTLESAAAATEQGLPALKTEVGIRPAPGAATGKSIVPADVGFAPIEIPSPANSKDRMLPN